MPPQLEQPMFPILEELDEHLVAIVRSKAYVHSGAFVSRDEELCRSVCTDLLTGLSRRAIAARHGISRNSVNAIREVMEARGDLEPLRKEIARRLDRCVIYSLENLEDATAKNLIAAGQLPIATAVLLDKKAALDGLPTARIEHVSARRMSHEELNAWLESLPSANPTPTLLVEDASSAPAQNSAENGPADSPSAEMSPETPPNAQDHG